MNLKVESRLVLPELLPYAVSMGTAITDGPASDKNLISSNRQAVQFYFWVALDNLN